MENLLFVSDFWEQYILFVYSYANKQICFFLYIVFISCQIIVIMKLDILQLHNCTKDPCEKYTLIDKNVKFQTGFILFIDKNIKAWVEISSAPISLDQPNGRNALMDSQKEERERIASIRRLIHHSLSPWLKNHEIDIGEIHPDVVKLTVTKTNLINCKKIGSYLTASISIGRWLDDPEYSLTFKNYSIDTKLIRFTVDYPLEESLDFTFKKATEFTFYDLVDCICDSYEKIYQKEEATDDKNLKQELSGYNRAASHGKYGIWGNV